MSHSIPKFLEEMLINDYGDEVTKEIKNGYDTDFPVMLRANSLKIDISNLKEKLKENRIQFKEVPWYEGAFYLENSKEDEIKSLSIYKNGEIYLQSLSSMIPALVIEPKKNENILDMTAAPRTERLLLCLYFLKMKQ